MASAERGAVEFTPWSAYIIEKFVFGWWDHVGDKDKLGSFRDDVIHRVGPCREEGSMEGGGGGAREKDALPSAVGGGGNSSSAPVISI